MAFKLVAARYEEVPPDSTVMTPTPYVDECKGGETIRFAGASDAQVKWGSGSDPRPHMKEGDEFVIEDVEVHSWHTTVSLVGVPGRFNSVCFEYVKS